MDSPSFIAEILGVCLVFVGLFKLDGINKSLGAFESFARTAEEELKLLRKRSHEVSNRLFILEGKLKNAKQDKSDR